MAQVFKYSDAVYSLPSDYVIGTRHDFLMPFDFYLRGCCIWGAADLTYVDIIKGECRLFSNKPIPAKIFETGASFEKITNQLMRSEKDTCLRYFKDAVDIKQLIENQKIDLPKQSVLIPVRQNLSVTITGSFTNFIIYGMHKLPFTLA